MCLLLSFICIPLTSSFKISGSFINRPHRTKPARIPVSLYHTFLENGDVPLDNNRAENAIRPFAVGRKNWMHCNTANGASWTAILYSILATAQANGIDAERCLTDLFSQPAGTIILPFDS